MIRSRILLATALTAVCGLATAPEATAQAACPPLPSGFHPQDPAYRFTMLIRINNQTNVDNYTQPNAMGGLANHIRPQDIFVINTRFQNNEGTSSPAVADDLARQLRTAFPCNRIIALNGLGIDPTLPGFIYALAGSSAGIHALMLDWEAEDWNIGRFYNSAMPPWSYKFRPSLRRIGAWTGGLSGILAGIGSSSRAGLVPLSNRGWNYGRIGQVLDRVNRRLGARHLGPQIVQGQEACMHGPRTFAGLTRSVLRSYKFKLVTRKRRRKGKVRRVRVRRVLKKRARPNRRNLALEISFSDTPSPGGALPVLNVAAITADRCVAAGLRRGAAAFFFFASDSSMRLLFTQPTMASLRPPL